MVLFLPAKEQLKVFNSAEHKHHGRTGSADDEHGFENPRQDGDKQETHKLTMLFETRLLDQFEIQMRRVSADKYWIASGRPK